ncbi:MAG: BlaI/MecI/CopY family transcriptional regulator [Gammaproteobacteria bacterium]|nr:BlaI/MecI/CopY family transcriptional regulator [Gammaproteobacteria bacterium]
MESHHNVSLSRRERQIMDVLYESGDCSARDIQAVLPAAPSYSTVRALLAILVDKGHIKHRQEGAKYVYSSVQAVGKVREGAVSRLLKTFFGGSTVQAVTALLGMKADSLSDEELAELSALIEQARQRRT